MKKTDLQPTGTDAFWQTPCLVLKEGGSVQLCRLRAISGQPYKIYTYSLFFRLLRRGFGSMCLELDRKLAANCRGGNYDTLGNRAIKTQMQALLGQLQAFKRRYTQSAYQPSKGIPGSVDRMTRILQTRIHGPILSRVLPGGGTMDRELRGYFALLEWGLLVCGQWQALPAQTQQRSIPAVGLPMGLLFAWAGASAWLVLGELTLPDGVEEALSKTQWDTPNVLVGSLGSMAQLTDNLNRNYYYVPARHFEERDISPKYIALYQSRNFFGEQAGIRYYGEVTRTQRLRRRSIDHPLTRDNGRELYYAFRVRQWKALPAPIAVREEWVSQPRFTNLFLMQQGRDTFELFNIHSAEQYRLFATIRQALERLRQNGGGIVIFRAQKDRLAVVTDAWITVTNGRGETLHRMSVSRFAQNPRGEFRELRKYCDK